MHTNWFSGEDVAWISINRLNIEQKNSMNRLRKSLEIIEDGEDSDRRSWPQQSAQNQFMDIGEGGQELSKTKSRVPTFRGVGTKRSTARDVLV